MRLNAFLSKSGAAQSRRKAEALILSGAVSLNGVPVTNLATRVASSDIVEVNGIPVQDTQHRLLYMMHKPLGYQTTVSDPYAQKTVYELLPEHLRSALHSIGRLDVNTSGLLLFTNDGMLTQQLTHPSFEHEKEYVLRVAGTLTSEQRKAFETGVHLEDGITSPARLHSITSSASATQFSLVLHEGRNRQIRRMCESLHLTLLSLHRIRMDIYELGDLPVGCVVEVPSGMQ